MIAQRHKELGEKGNYTANSSIKMLGTLMNYAINNLDLLFENPVMVMNKKRAWFKVTRNPNIIPDHQLAAWYRAVMALIRLEVRDYLLSILLVGLRRTEALMLRWSDVDFNTKTLTIPAEVSKNHQAHILPLSDILLALLAQRKSKCGESAWVFPGKSGEKPMCNPQFEMTLVETGSGCDFSPHACRRTFITVASRISIPHQIVRKLVNHSQVADLTSSYIIIGTEAMREPMQQISERFIELMQCDPSDWLLPASGSQKTKTIKPPTLAVVQRQYLLRRKLRLSTQTNYEKCIRVDLVTGLTCR